VEETHRKPSQVQLENWQKEWKREIDNKDAPFNFLFSLSFGNPADPVFVQLSIGANMQLPSYFECRSSGMIPL